MGARVRALRRELDFSFDAFVEEVGLGRGYVSELERGLVVPSLTALTRLAAALETTVPDLVLGATPRERLFELTRGLSSAHLEHLIRSVQALRGPESSPLPFRRADGPESPRAMPVLALRPAAGPWTGPQSPETVAWVEPGSRVKPRPGHFIARVAGSSMAPAIPDGAWCLFERPWPQPRHGEVGIFSRLDSGEPAGAARFTLKEFRPELAETDEGVALTNSLRSRNRAFRPLGPLPGAEHRDRPFARFIRVLAVE